MPHITVSIADLKALSGIADLTTEKLDALAPLLKGEVKLKASTADEAKVELQDTNRPDTWTVEGIARQLRRHAGLQPLDDPARLVAQRRPAGTIEVDPALEQVRPWVAGFIARGWKVDEAGLLAFISAQEVLCKNFGRKRKSVAIGIYDASRMKLPVRYQAVPMDDAARAFVPLAPADAQNVLDGAGKPIPAARWRERWTPRQIVADHPTGREYAAALASSEVAPFLVDASGAVLSFPPLINSADLGRVVPGMDVLFVETTGTVLDQVLLASNILAANLQDRGATIEPLVTRYPYDSPRGREVVCPHPLADRRSIDLDLADVQRLLGEPGIGIEEAERCLVRFGVAVERKGPTRLVATTPPWRLDYLHAVDAVEDVAISRGYQRFAPLLPEEFTVGGLAPMTAFADRARELMIGSGFEEAIGNILCAEEDVRVRMRLDDRTGCQPVHGGALVRIDNVMNRNYAVLRDWIVPTLLEVESRSTSAAYPHRVFEVGEVAVWDPEADHASRTELRLAALLSHDKAGFSELQAVLHELLRRHGLAFQRTPAPGGYALLPCEHPSFLSVPGHVTRVVSGDTVLGLLGEVHPEVLERWGIHAPVVAFELRLDALAQLAR